MVPADPPSRRDIAAAMTETTGDGGALQPTETARLARRSVFNFVGLAAAQALQLALLLALSRGLGRGDAGLFFEGFAFVRLLAVVAALGLDVTVIRYVAVHHTQNHHAKARAAVRFALVLATAISLVATVAVLLLAPFIASAFGSSRLEFVLRVMVLSLPANVVQMVLIGATRGAGSMRGFVFVDQILDGGLRFAAIAVVLALGLGLDGTTIAYTASAVLTAIASAVAARRFLVGAAVRDRGSNRQLLAFTSYQWGAVIANVGLLWADTLLLGLWRPPAEVAVYSVATRTAALGMVFMLPIGVAFQPVIARLYTLGEMRRLAAMYSFATKWATVSGCPPITFVALFATPILLVLYPDSYASGAWPLALLCAAQTINAASGPCGNVATMIGRTDLVFLNTAVALVANLALNIILIPPYGMIGAGAAWAVSIVLLNVLRLYQVWRVLSIHPFRGWPTRVAIALGAFTVAASLLRVGLNDAAPLLQLVVAGVLSSVVYLVALLLLGLVDRRSLWPPSPALLSLRQRG
jgi:O-antigen/teichoic acid export membrane protein